MFNTLPREALRRTHNSIKLKMEDRKYSKLRRSRSMLEGGGLRREIPVEEARSPIEMQRVGNGYLSVEEGMVGLRAGGERERERDRDQDVEKGRGKREERERVEQGEIEVEGVKFKLEDPARAHLKENQELEFGIGERRLEVPAPERKPSRKLSRKGKHVEQQIEDAQSVTNSPPPETSKLGPIILKGFLGRGLETVIRFWGYQDLLACSTSAQTSH